MEYLRLDSFTEYSFLSSVKLSGDGKKTALIVKRANSKNGYDSIIYLDKGEGYKPLTRLYGNVLHFIWLDNDNILFAENRVDDKPAHKGLPYTAYYSININGGEALKRFCVDIPVSSIEKAADGNFIIHSLYDNNMPDFTGKSQDEINSLLEEVNKEKDYQVIDELPYWTDGGSFINKKRKRLYLFNPNGKEGALTPLTPPLCRAESFEVSECGKYILFSGDTEYKGVKDIKNNLYILDIASKSIDKLTSEPMFIKDFKFWGDKAFLAASFGKNYSMGENPNFYTIGLKDKTMTLLKEFDGPIGSSVNSDSTLGEGNKSIIADNCYYFISTAIFHADIYKFDLLTKEISNITNAQGNVMMFDVSGNVFKTVSMLKGKLQEVFEFADGNYIQLSSFNDEVYDKYKHPVIEHHVFKDEEGIEFDGWAALPVDYDPSKKYPAVLDIHGGPRGVYSDVYMHEIQYLANRNYFVIFSNPRGSDGKGNAFADVRGKYGEIDYRNIMQFTDEMVKKYPAIDESRLGVTGGSYGGYMTNWIIGHTDKFKAAVSQRSICNWFSYMIGDLGYFFTDYDILSNPWDNPEKLWYHSPLKYVDKAKTPTLLIHSDNDYRCSIPEAYQMFTALKLHGVDTRLCIFHGESHGLSRIGKPEHRIRRLKEITDWMDKYLL